MNNDTDLLKSLMKSALQAVLQCASSRLARLARTLECLFRYGGEEFSSFCRRHRLRERYCSPSVYAPPSSL